MLNKKKISIIAIMMLAVGIGFASAQSFYKTANGSRILSLDYYNNGVATITESGQTVSFMGYKIYADGGIQFFNPMYGFLSVSYDMSIIVYTNRNNITFVFYRM